MLDTAQSLSDAPELLPIQTDVVLAAPTIERQMSAAPPVPPISRMPTMLRSPNQKMPGGIGTKHEFVVEVAHLLAGSSAMDTDADIMHMGKSSTSLDAAVNIVETADPSSK